MPDPRAVPESEVRERLAGLPKVVWCWARNPDHVLEHPERHPNLLRFVGVRFDGTAYLDTEGSQE